MKVAWREQQHTFTAGQSCQGEQGATAESSVQMATKEDIKPGYEEGASNSRIRITLTCQDVPPLEKGALPPVEASCFPPAARCRRCTGIQRRPS